MKHWRPLVLLCLGLSCGISSVSLSSCAVPSQRVVAVQTLRAVGESAESAVALSAQLYKNGRLTAAQAREVIDLYDKKFQPAFRLAVAAVNSDLSSPASPDVVNLALQLVSLVNSYVK